jgi:RNA polymerase sigma factor (sigma-70 family)
MDCQSVYLQYFKPAYRYFYYKGVEKAEVEDLAQETFLRLFRVYGDRADLADLEIRKLVYGVARNVWREWVRRQVQLPTVEFDELQDVGESPDEFQEEAEDTELLEAQRAAVLAAIEDLHPTMRQVLTLRFAENLSRQEVADRLNIKPDEVHTYQKRGIKMLQKIVRLPITHID